MSDDAQRFLALVAYAINIPADNVLAFAPEIVGGNLLGGHLLYHEGDDVAKVVHLHRDGAGSFAPLGPPRVIEGVMEKIRERLEALTDEDTAH